MAAVNNFPKRFLRLLEEFSNVSHSETDRLTFRYITQDNKFLAISFLSGYQLYSVFFRGVTKVQGYPNPDHIRYTMDGDAYFLNPEYTPIKNLQTLLEIDDKELKKFILQNMEYFILMDEVLKGT